MTLVKKKYFFLIFFLLIIYLFFNLEALNSKPSKYKTIINGNTMGTTYSITILDSILSNNDDVLVDLGGFVDERSIPVLEKSKTVVIPTLGSFLSLSGLIGTLEEVQNFNREKILNKLEKIIYEITQ